jgi:glutamate-1-semialdehyde 2,1-aminomutase
LGLTDGQQNDDKKPIRQVSMISKKHKEFFALFFKHLISEKIFMAPNGYEVGFIGYAHTPEILNLAAEKIIKALSATYKNFN